MSDGPDFAIYKSSHHDVLKAWEDAHTNRAAYNDRMQAQLAAWGFPEGTEIVVTQSAWVTTELLGIYWPKRDVPEGWRKDGRHTRIVPYAKQKQLSAEYGALRKVPDLRRDLVALGMPHHMFAGLYVTTYATAAFTPSEFGDPEIWVKWHNTDPLASDQWWTKVKLSEYYAMVESGTDPFAKKSDETDE